MVCVGIPHSRMHHQTRKYLESLIAKWSRPRAHDSLHAIHVDLNASTGMYWLVSSWVILERLSGGQTDAVMAEHMREFVLKQIDTHGNFRLDEHNGFLRTLSLVQTVLMLFEEGNPVREELLNRVGTDTLTFVEAHFPQNIPFFFDMRGMYCLVLILRLSGHFGCLLQAHRDFILDYVFRSQALLGGFGAGPASEAHGGYTFCAVATLKLLGASVPHENRLLVWLGVRLSQFNGRPGKPRDSCYCWWVGATRAN